jgi:hypothetical protein
MKNILVFPCGSEIGLEIFRSLKYSIHFNLIGGNSVEDHGRFVYEQYVGDIPFIDDASFIEKLNEVITKHDIHLLYPTMDFVIARLGKYKDQILCDVIGSPYDTSLICFSKKSMDDCLGSKIPMAELYKELPDVKEFPVFLKPVVGYSGKGTAVVYNYEEAAFHLQKRPDCLIMEYLPGEEYTVDCFTNKERELLFSGTRLRSRIANGISVNTKEAIANVSFEMNKMATEINKYLHFRGAWFFQVKIANDKTFKLMEVAARLGGSSGLFRAKGVNFAMLSVWDALGMNVTISQNDYIVEMDRALDNKFKIDFAFDKVFIDFDDTLVINEKVNTELVTFLFQCRNEKKEIVLISRHKFDIEITLERFALKALFDKIIHLRDRELKSSYISHGAIFIDDSHAERLEVANICKIPVFAPDMISALIK